MSVKKGMLLDTNIWLNAYIPERDGAGTCRAIIENCLKNKVPIYFAITSLKDVFYVLERNMKKHLVEAAFQSTDGSSATPAQSESIPYIAHEYAWSIVDTMCQIGTPVAMDMSDTWIAQHLRSDHEDLEDNLVIAACMRADAGYLVTADKELKMNSRIATLLPHQALAVLELA